MRVKVKKLHKDARLPTYATDGSGCFDILVLDTDDGYGWEVSPSVTSGGLPTGLSFEIPAGYVMLVFSRSGHGFKNSVRLSNCVGVIDSDYRGELKVSIHNDGVAAFPVTDGMRIAQALVVPIPHVEFVLSDALSSTERGDGGFGSTGS